MIEVSGVLLQSLIYLCIITIYHKKLRIDKYLIEELDYSRSKIQRMIENKAILVNDKEVKNSYVLKLDDEIEINENYSEEVDIVAEDIPLDIYYEDVYM